MSIATIEDTPAVREFRAIDRCDQCGARAVGAAVKNESELLFCGHDLKKNYDALLDQGFTVTEDYESYLDE